MMQVYDGLSFPESAIAYLLRHKGDADGIPRMCERQATRARKQFEALSPYIGKGVKRVLDIGCGLGAIDVVLASKRSITDLYLVDGDGSVERHGEYREVSEPWNNVADAVEFVEKNVPDSVLVVSAWPITNVDFVISLKSWGLHYPVATYLDRVSGIIELEGTLIIDLHKPEARKALEGVGFTCVATIGDYEDQGTALLPFVRHIFKKVA
jgi:hypothetical protein